MLLWILVGFLLLPALGHSATRLGLHATLEEKNIWNARRTDNVNGIGGITYKTMWDTRILADANTFKGQAHPGGDGRWRGWTAGGCFPEGRRVGAMRSNGWKMQKAAFVFLVTGDNTYATGVAQELLSQIDLPGTDWTNRDTWCLGYKNTVTMIDLLPWLTRLLYAYDYLLAGGYTGFTPAQKTAIQTWFVNGALYWEDLLTNVLKRRFSGVRNTPPNYTCDGVACPGADIRPTHFGSTNMARSFSIGWHNPQSLTASYMGSTGIVANHAGLKQRATYFYQEFLRFSTWADGSIHDQSRWDDAPNSPDGVIDAWSHMYMQLQPMIILADHFARAGDPSLYDYQSPGGQFGTGGGNVNLFTVVRRFARLENNTEQAYGADTAGQANENTRLRSKPPTFKREANHVGGAMANIRFQNAEIETSYSGVQGAQTGCGAFGACYAGAWGLFPDMLFLFGNQEGVVDPYTFGPAAQPDFTSNLTMHLTFDEGTLTTAEDSTANNHDGTLGSGATWGPAKMGASAVVLDGTTNGVVTVTGELGTPAAVTLAAWVKASAFPTPTADLISIGDSVILRITSTAVRGDYYTGATWSNMSATRMLGTTDWHHLALVVQAGTQQLYLDGAPVASESNGAPIVYTGVGSNTILGGHGNGDTTNFRFQGQLDDVRVYSRVLSATDIAGLAALGFP